MNNPAVLFEFLCEASVCLAVFALLYLFLLKELTHYQGKRFFILASFAISLAIACMQVEVVQFVEPTPASNFTLSQLFPQVSFMGDENLAEGANEVALLSQLMAHWQQLLLLFFGAGSMAFTCQFVVQWVSLKKRLRHANLLPTTSNVYESDSIESAFSFAGKVYLPSSFRQLPKDEIQQVIAHEQAHIQLRHDWDILILGVLKSLFWFHPFYWLFSKELRTNHEYHVDQLVTASIDSSRYSELLLKLNGTSIQSPITSYFAQHLIKKRVMKLHQSPSTPMKKILFALIIPVAMVLFYAFSIDQISRTERFSTAIEKVTVKPFILPVPEAAITKTSPFGMRKHPKSSTRKMHRGIDLVVPSGTEVYAAADGIVLETQTNKGGYGIKLILSHQNNLFTTYAHLKSFTVKAGAKVSQGEVIGYAGNTGVSTGPHLHFEVLKGKEFVDPELHLSLSAFNHRMIDQKVDRDELVIILDAGHGGADAGVSVASILEKELSLKFAKSLQGKLKHAGLNVLLVRDDDRMVSLNARSELTHNRKEALFISLHLNESKSATASGFEIYIPNDKHSTHKKSLLFANITDRLLAQNGIESRGVKTANFKVLSNNECPAVLLELGYLSSEKDLKQLQTVAYQDQLCALIAKAVDQYAK